MFTAIVTFLTWPAELITRIFDNKIVAEMFMFIFRMMCAAIILVPLMTNISFSDTLSYTFFAPLQFIFGTLPFAFYDYMVATYGKGISTAITLLCIVYWAVMAVVVPLTLVRVGQHYKAKPSADSYVYADEVKPSSSNHIVSDDHDANDEYLISGLTTLQKTFDADVQANAIARALRKS